MNTKDVKDIRKQLRNIVQEMAPTMFAQEMLDEMRKANADSLQAAVAKIFEFLKTMEQRQKDLESYIVRTLLPQGPIAQTEESPAAALKTPQVTNNE